MESKAAKEKEKGKTAEKYPRGKSENDRKCSRESEQKSDGGGGREI